MASNRRASRAAARVLPLSLPTLPSLLAVAAVMALASCSDAGSQQKGPPQGPPEVGTVQVQQREVTLSADYPAQLEALRQIEVRPQIGGVVTRVAYKEGAPIAKGAVMFEIDPRPFEAAREQARAAVAQAQAGLIKAEADIKRIEPLVAADAASQQDLDNARAQLQVGRANLLGAEAALRTAELNLGYATIRAPEAGLAARSEVRPGSVAVPAQSLLTTVYSNDPMAATFAMSERDFLALQQRTQAGAAPSAKVFLVDGSEYPLPATLDFFNAALDPRSATMQVRMRIPNPKGTLRAGQFVRLVLIDPKPMQALLVPQRAVQETLGQRAVMVVDPDGKVAPRPVVMGARLGDDWVVERGVKAGERVLVDGFARVRPGATVKPVDGSAAPPGGAPGGAPAAAPPPAKAETKQAK
jgi:membrane fusion protein (multidrug efflux system)